MKNETYILVFEGTYRDSDYLSLTGSRLVEYHYFEILLSYSTDGINWSNPVEVYIPKNNESLSIFSKFNEISQRILIFQKNILIYELRQT